jgi:phosphoribosyl 1,2-cyclic phosphate phosphodiesterase
MTHQEQQKTRIVIMGCGGSGGVPYTGNMWGKCDPNNPKNRRTRPSVYIEKGDTRIVIDTGPELRLQLNAVGAKPPIAAVLYTHSHFDHTSGMDDLRAIMYANNRTPIPTYARQHTLDDITQRFHFVVASTDPSYPSLLTLNKLDADLMINNVHIQSFDTYHDTGKSLIVSGFRIGDFAYTTDSKILTEEAFEILQGVKIWVCGIHSDPEGGYNHPSLNEVITWNQRIKAEKVYTTHMSASLDYEDLKARMPNGFEPAYDGLEFWV